MQQSLRQSVHQKLLGMKSKTYGFFSETGKILLMFTNMMKQIKNKSYCNSSDNVHGKLKDSVLKDCNND